MSAEEKPMRAHDHAVLDCPACQDRQRDRDILRATVAGMADRLAYLERVEKAAKNWSQFGPQDPHGDKCTCDPEVGFRDPSCYAYADFMEALASKPAAIKPCCLCPDNHYPECPRASKPASRK